VTEVNFPKTPPAPSPGHSEPKLAVEERDNSDLSGEEDSGWVQPRGSEADSQAKLSESISLGDGLAAWTVSVNARS
jgi:hypothetical protein